jgi:hypothetical protein
MKQSGHFIPHRMLTYNIVHTKSWTRYADPWIACHPYIPTDLSIIRTELVSSSLVKHLSIHIMLLSFTPKHHVVYSLTFMPFLTLHTCLTRRHGNGRYRKVRPQGWVASTSWVPHGSLRRCRLRCLENTRSVRCSASNCSQQQHNYIRVHSLSFLHLGRQETSEALASHWPFQDCSIIPSYSKDPHHKTEKLEYQGRRLEAGTWW